MPLNSKVGIDRARSKLHPAHLVGRKWVPELANMGGMDGLQLRPMVPKRFSKRSAGVGTAAPLFTAGLKFIGHSPIRNGTVGGSVSHADLAAGLPTLKITPEEAGRDGWASGQSPGGGG